MESLLVVVYLVNLTVLCVYGFHRAHLVVMCALTMKRAHAVAAATPPVDFSTRSLDSVPQVTIQLPLFNEATVVERLLAAVDRIDYPRSRLEVQVLDDSTDETRELASRRVAELRANGLDIHYVRRPTREGYKAGALEYGLETAKGELIAIFDADFVPNPSFLRDLLGHFDDPEVAMVQARWGHMNRDESLLTNVQALMLDGHHLVENRARFSAGCFFNFAGTGGVWRREAIEDAGGWQHDTITEDLDLSYRAQLKGWRFIYRPDLVVPAELPEDMSAFRAQQFRWAKGTVQTARKLLGPILRAPISFHERFEAFFHLTPHFAYPLMVVLSVLMLPIVMLMPAKDWTAMLVVDLPLCLGSTGSLALFYMMAEYMQGRPVTNALIRLPALIALNAGLAPNQARAVIAGSRSMAGEFVRTAKRGHTVGRYKQTAMLPWPELVLGAISAVATVAAVQTGHYFATPFAALFSAGFFYVSFLVIREQLRPVVSPAESVLDAAAATAPAEQVARAA